MHARRCFLPCRNTQNWQDLRAATSVSSRAARELSQRNDDSVRAAAYAVISARRCLTRRHQCAPMSHSRPGGPGGSRWESGGEARRRRGERRTPSASSAGWAAAALRLHRRQPMRQRSVQRRGQQPRRRRLACGVSGRILAGRGARQLIKDAGRHEGVVERHARAPEAPQARRACGVHARQQRPPGPRPARRAAGEACAAAAAAQPSHRPRRRYGGAHAAASPLRRSVRRPWSPAP